MNFQQKGVFPISDQAPASRLDFPNSLFISKCLIGFKGLLVLSKSPVCCFMLILNQVNEINFQRKIYHGSCTIKIIFSHTILALLLK